MILESAFPQPPPDNGITAPQDGEAHKAIDKPPVCRIIGGFANQNAPGEDRMGAEIVKLLWEWDPERITNLVRLCIQVGTHPESWKTAKGIVIPKPGKPDYRQVRAHRVIALLDSIGKLVEKTAARLIADQLERSRSLHEGQYGCRRRRSCVDAVAVLIANTERAWSQERIAGALLMDVKSAFNNVIRGHLVGCLMELGIESDLVRWTESFVSDRKVRLVLNGQEGSDHEVGTGIPQGSPAPPILFTVYLSGLFGHVEERVPGIKALSFVDDVAWTAEGANEEDTSERLEQAASAAQEWGEANAVTFDTERRKQSCSADGRNVRLQRGIQVAGRTIQFNAQATRWLGIWLDSQLTLKEHHEVRMKKARNAQNRLRRLAGQVGLSPENCRRVLSACVQASALFGSELWWKGENAHGMVGRLEAAQKLANQEARSTMGAFRTTNQGH